MPCPVNEVAVQLRFLLQVAIMPRKKRRVDASEAAVKEGAGLREAAPATGAAPAVAEASSGPVPSTPIAVRELEKSIVSSFVNVKGKSSVCAELCLVWGSRPLTPHLGGRCVDAAARPCGEAHLSGGVRRSHACTAACIYCVH